MTATTPAAPDPWAFWLDALRGRNPDHVRGRAECGYWRVRQRDGRIVPLFLWRHGASDTLYMIRDCGEQERVGDEDLFCERVWAYALRHPVHSSEYRDYRATRTWSEESLARYEAEDRAHKERIQAQRARA